MVNAGTFKILPVIQEITYEENGNIETEIFVEKKY